MKRDLFPARRVVLWAALAASGAALAGGAVSPPTGGGMMGGGMMGGNMMDMMQSCHAMMSGGPAMGMMGMPKLPPGNEKLEMQMRAEMMQKMGEIAAKYADRIKDSR